MPAEQAGVKKQKNKKNPPLLILILPCFQWLILMSKENLAQCWYVSLHSACKLLLLIIRTIQSEPKNGLKYKPSPWEYVISTYLLPEMSRMDTHFLDPISAKLTPISHSRLSKSSTANLLSPVS